MRTRIRRRRAARSLAGLVGLLAAALLPLSPAGMLAAAHADTSVATFDGKEIKDLCTISGSGQSCPAFPAPPELLNPAAVEAAGSEVAASMRRLEDQAVANTMADHGLPASDHDAVLSWGRADAQAELWVLIVGAIKTAASDRTVDQQHAVDWMAGLVTAQSNESALHAGAEYATWAGLDVKRYWNMARTASASDLATFLSEPVRAYDPQNTPRGGYCRYTAPDPDSGAYDGSMAAACYHACPSVQQCGYPVPKYDDFVSWGEDAATSATLNDSSFAAQAAELATTVSLLAAGVAFVLSGVETSITLISAAAITAVELAPAFAGLVTVGTVTSGFLGTSVPLTIAAGAFIGSVLVVIASIVMATLEGIRVFDNEALPGRLADLVVGARSATSDPASLIGTTDGATTLYALFVAATLPAPRLGLGCDNSLIPPWAYTSSGDPNLLVYVPLGQHDTVTTPVDGHGCLNPPPISPTEPTDPHFVVTNLADYTESVSPTLTLGDAGGRPAAQARIHGNWFVERDLQTSGVSGQSLQLRFLGTSGDLQVAWLVHDHGAYRFLGVDAGSATSIDPDTCRADGTCWERATIDYLGPDGHKLAARVEPYQTPRGTPSFSPSSPVEGSPVTLDARDFGPADGTNLTYTWRFQRLGCGWLPCVLAGQHDADGRAVPSYSPARTGRTVTYTWQGMGSAKVELTATDPVGRTAVTTFIVTVGNVPPRLLLFRTAHAARTGTPFVLDARFADASDSDDENLEITWGDGNSDTVKAGPDAVNLLVGYHPLVTKVDPTTYALSACHTYAQPGTYYGTVQVSDWGGGTDSAPFTITVS